MVTVINYDTVSDRAAYLPLAKAFCEDSLKNEKGIISMKVYADADHEDIVVYISEWETREDFKATVGGEVFNRHIPAMAPYFKGAKDIILTEF